MKAHTIAFTVLVDEDTTRIRCYFCGAILHAKQGAFVTYDLPEFIEAAATHPCFTVDAFVRRKIPSIH